MSGYTSRPWLSRYPDGQAADITREYDTALEMFQASAARSPDLPAIQYFDAAMTFQQLDRASDALAAALAGQGFAAGDRLALYVQNNPAFVIGLLAAWKAGGAAVAINPMNRARELSYLLEDSGAVALLALDDLFGNIAQGVLATGRTQVRTVITVSGRDGQTRDDPRLLAGVQRTRHPGTLDLYELIQQFSGEPPARPASARTTSPSSPTPLAPPACPRGR